MGDQFIDAPTVSKRNIMTNGNVNVSGGVIASYTRTDSPLLWPIVKPYDYLNDWNFCDTPLISHLPSPEEEIEKYFDYSSDRPRPADKRACE